MRFLLRALCALLALQVVSPSPSITLRLVKRVPTQGNAGFEYFFHSGAPYLASANFWDGKSPDMSANSELYTLAIGSEGNLSLTSVQKFHTQGAHGWDAFTSPHDPLATYLVVPNYYGCGSERGPATGSCKSTVVYRAAGGVGMNAPFKEHQRLLTSGPAQTDHLLLPPNNGGGLYIIVGENFNDQVCLYQQQTTTLLFEKHGTCLAVPGAGAMAVAWADKSLFLVASSYHDGRTGWSTRTLVFKAEFSQEEGGLLSSWKAHQELPTNGCHDAEFETIGGTHYLFLSEDRDPDTSKTTSGLYTLTEGRFQLLQRIPTDGAHAGELFEGPGGEAFLAIANFGDRLGQRYAARSSVWRRGREGGLFALVVEVQTQGATDVEHFVLEGKKHFLAFSNEGDIGKRTHQVSHIYEVVDASVVEAGKGEL
jgi:hypothetical protein